MATLNQCQFIGNLGRDPEVRHSQTGEVICNFSIAVSEVWRDKSSGEKKESTEWVKVVAFRRLGEVCGEYLQKGSAVWVQGKMKTRKWQDQSGQDRYTTEIIAENMQMLGGRGNDASGAQSQSQAPQNQQSRTQAPQQNYQADMGGMSAMDSDIPFAPLLARNAYAI